jgi:hypothetical protein
VWKNARNVNRWERRVRLSNYIVSRMYSISLKDIERYLRILLCHVARAKSFEDLRTHENVEYQTFKDACRARNLSEDDGKWHNCLREDCVFEMPSKLRQLFIFICVFYNPDTPVELWESFKTEL